jgi:hypothetical protein
MNISDTSQDGSKSDLLDAFIGILGGALLLFAATLGKLARDYYRTAGAVESTVSEVGTVRRELDEAINHLRTALSASSEALGLISGIVSILEGSSKLPVRRKARVIRQKLDVISSSGQHETASTVGASAGDTP